MHRADSVQRQNSLAASSNPASSRDGSDARQSSNRMSIVPLPQSNLLNSHLTPFVTGSSFKSPGGSNTREPKSTITSIRDLTSMHDGRPKLSQQPVEKLEHFQRLSKNQIRRMKKKQRRLLDEK